MFCSIVIPVMGGLIESKPFWGLLLNMVTGPAELIVIDNSPEADTQLFLGRFVDPFWPGEVVYQSNDNNVGLVQSLQQGYELARANIIVYMHNDVYIYQSGWDVLLKNVFESRKNQKVGLVGLFGAEQAHVNGGRVLCYSAMLEAEIHGNRMQTELTRQVSVLDGLFMAASREMLEARDGVDTTFEIHHFYDLDLSLESLDRGYTNWVVNVPFHHQSGVTACRPLYQEWAKQHGGDLEIYNRNKERYIAKWNHRLPHTLEGGFHG